MNLSRSFSVCPTAFKNAPYVEMNHNSKSKTPIQPLASTFPPANISELNGICQSNSMLRHIKCSDIDKGRIGVLLGTSCVQFTHALEKIRRSPTDLTVSKLNSDGPPPVSSCIGNEQNRPLEKISSFSPQPKSTKTMPIGFHLTCLNNTGQLKKPPVNPPNPSFSPMSTKKPSKYLKKTCRHNGLPWKTDDHLSNNYYPPSTVSVPSKNV